ncbi:MAG: GtrA family protein [Clostridia bacterium]|nr:GtrA family protein [Clostridia bacterium]
MKDLFIKYKEILLYLVFGVLTTIVSLAVYYLLTIILLDPNNPLLLQIANIISWICGVAFAYVTNRKYVFESNNENKVKELTTFVGARIVTLLLDMLIMGLGVSVIQFNDKVMKILSQIVVILLNYVFSKLIVFRGKKNESS